MNTDYNTIRYEADDGATISSGSSPNDYEGVKPYTSLEQANPIIGELYRLSRELEGYETSEEQ